MRIFCFTLACLIPYLSLAQEDSIYRVLSALPLDSVRILKLNDLAFSLITEAPNKAMKYSEEALSLAEDIAYPTGQARSFYILGSAFLQTGHPDDALDNYTHSLQICNKYNLRKAKCDALRGLALYFKAIGDIEMAKRYALESAEITHELGDRLGEAKSYINLGNLMDNHERILYQLRAIQLLETFIAQEINNIPAMTSLMIAYIIASDYYRSDKKIDSAFFYVKKADEFNKIANNKYIELSIENSLCFIYYEIENYDLSITTGIQALNLASTLEIEDEITIGINRMVGHAYEKKENFPLAIKHYSNAYNIAEKVGNTNIMTELNLESSNIFLSMRQYDNALRAAINALNLARMQEYFVQMANGELLVGKILVAQHKDVEAIQHFQNCFLLVNQNNLVKSNYVELYKDLADAYTRQQQPAKAAEMQQLYSELSAKQ